MTTAIVPPSPAAVNQTAVLDQTLLVEFVGASRCLSHLNGNMAAATDPTIPAEALRALEQRGVDPYQPRRGREGNHADESTYYPGDKAFAGHAPQPGDDPLADDVIDGDAFEEAA